MSYETDRKRLVDKLKATGYIKSNKVEKAMLKVPRHMFMPSYGNAYADRPQSIGSGQTISAPHMVAMMVEALDLQRGQKVLEVGGGRGYHAAVISELVGKEGMVYTVELIKSLAEKAGKTLSQAGYEEVKVIVADGSKGYPPAAPFDRISVACGAPKIPPPLVEQLKPEGKLLIPIGGGFYQELALITKSREGKVIRKGLGGVVFVPLKGEYGH